mgnify:CR=1 FL=1
MIGRGDESPLSLFTRMNFDIVKAKIEEWVTPLMEEKNFFLVDVRSSFGRKIEVYIDSDEGVHIDDCAMVSRFIEKHLDGSGIVPDNYILEVSSPGMSNPLKVPRQYKKRIGRLLEVVKTTGDKIEAELVAADDKQIVLREVVHEVKKKKKTGMEEKKEPPKEWTIPYTDIKKALLVFNF